MDEGPERQLNIHMEPQHLAGVYANFANITFSDYEFTLTFARIDHEVEDGDVPGVVVARVNMSQQFAQELLAAHAGRVLEVHDGQGHPGPARDRSSVGLTETVVSRGLSLGHGRSGHRFAGGFASRHRCAIARRCISVGWFSSHR